jgi:hypothetical protein
MQRHLLTAVAGLVALAWSSPPAEAGGLPKPISTIKRQKTDDHHDMAALHDNRGPGAISPIQRQKTDDHHDMAALHDNPGPEPISPIQRQKTDDHHDMAALHASRGPRPDRRGMKATPADEDRDKRRTHGVREE